MWDSVIALGLQIIIGLVTFCIGRFVLPKLPKDTAAVIQDKLNLVTTYATQYVNWADRFMDGAGGTEKLNAVVGNLKEIATRYGLQATDQDLTAIAQTAFEKMSLEWDNLEGNINAKAQEMAASMCTSRTPSREVAHLPSSVDQQTIDEANEALMAALDALTKAKKTITELKAAQTTQVPTPTQQPLDNAKKMMQDKISALRSATSSLLEIVEDDIEPEAFDENDEAEEVLEDDVVDTPRVKIAPETVVKGMQAVQTPTPMSLKELAAQQTQKAVAKVASSKTPPDDLDKYLH